MRVARVRFIGHGVPVPGTSLTQWDFGPGWLIDIEGGDVTLERPADEAQNLSHVPPFTVRGLPFWMRQAEPVYLEPAATEEPAPVVRRRRKAA